LDTAEPADTEPSDVVSGATCNADRECASKHCLLGRIGRTCRAGEQQCRQPESGATEPHDELTAHRAAS
jgi:hypothetical protein